MTAVQYYWQAASLEKSDDYDKLIALEMYWYSGFCSDLAVHLIINK
jgi:hypothetical protein